MPPSFPLELDASAMRSLVASAIERIVDHVESLPTQPAAAAEGGAELARTIRSSFAEGGRPVDELLDELFDSVVPCSFNTAGPGYLAYIPGGGLFPSAVADLVASSVNRYVGVFAAAPGLVQLEVDVIRWLCDAVGYPPASLGILTSGGSLANFSAVVAARGRLGEDFLDGTLYLSDQTHHSVEKAARLAGFPARAIRRIPCDDDARIRLDRLREALAADRAAGLRPFLLVANAGTTNTGAVDPLPELAALAREEGLWLHVDAAYGGFFVLTEEGRARLHGIEEADSIVLDPHKGLFLPYGTGALLVRDVEALRRTHSVGAEYLPAMQSEHDLVDFCEISPELSRRFRGLAVWLPLRMLGVAAFREALDEKLALARWIAGELSEVEDVELLAPPVLSLLAFRLRPPGLAGDELDELNRELLGRVNARRRVYLTGTTLPRGFVLRICVLSFRTHRDRVEMALDDLVAEIEALRAAGWRPGQAGGVSPSARKTDR